jgi:hypothetical protein
VATPPSSRFGSPLVLMAARNQARRLRSTPNLGSDGLRDIPLRAVENPQQAPVDVLVLAVSAGGAEQQLGALSLFPIDRPAVFAVRLHNAARIGSFD